ncbi:MULTISPECIES: flavin reductase family protein [Burkholderia]|uniref:Flavin reductase n=1 Tax=Burkholderia aenigmatica TaxID=2015348 RepID=A0A6J5J2R0_9BURK|nr:MULTISPECIES: flavin reductase family protein [Burkholderia]AYQ44167.1 nitrilotriacetate monooxygenase [Burkholderia lata]MCA8297935.1 flavin reductase family protein [Burkholderia sp. AU30198]CAB3965906.1 flavin reductase [Burkholderia aenigmatica]VWC70224.1 flavin reductase [Burkholderia aenigmatica]VWC94695.1 flavin reductase [Burkholderia aenigmatica]
MRHDHDIVAHAWRHHHEIPQAPGDFRRALGCFATGVTVVTTVDDEGRRIGLTANSFSSVSIDPPLILWSLARRSPNLRAFERCRFFAVNVLAGSQQDICTRFAKPIDDRFSGVDTVDGQGGVPLIAGAVAQFECENEIVHAGGDHAIFVGRVNRFRWHEQAPLVFCMGALRELDTNRQES